MKTILVIGVGATGRLLVKQLLERGHNVRIVVRSPEKLPSFLSESDRLSINAASLLELSDQELAEQVRGCYAVASCLGHNLSLKGVFGNPRRLVTEATRRLCQVAKSTSSGKPVKFILMNTTGNRNRDLDEPISFSQKLVVGLLRLLLPPHADNEQAAEYLRTEISQNDDSIEWAAVRPDGLIDLAEVTEYSLYPSPTRSPIFDPGQTSRVNAAHFMADLITEEDTWSKWKGHMPVIYNA